VHMQCHVLELRQWLRLAKSVHNHSDNLPPLYKKWQLLMGIVDCHYLRKTPYQNPPKLLEILSQLDDLEPKLTAKAMKEWMKAMEDNDGGLLFCWSKCLATSMLLTEDQIQSWINTKTKEKVKRNAYGERFKGITSYDAGTSRDPKVLISVCIEIWY
jgi:hypothetical protein